MEKPGLGLSMHDLSAQSYAPQNLHQYNQIELEQGATHVRLCPLNEFNLSSYLAPPCLILRVEVKLGSR